MITPPLTYREVTIGNATLKKNSKGTFVLTVDDNVWMTLSPGHYSQLYQQLLEYEIGEGSCLITGLGLGGITLLLAKKSNVTHVTVYEKNTDIIKLFYYFCEINNISQEVLNKISIIEQDANTIKDQAFDYGFFDHFELETGSYIIECVRNISLNNNIKKIWFWPIGDMYLKWCINMDRTIDYTSLNEYINIINIKNIFNDINPLTHYFAITGYCTNNKPHYMYGH